MDHIIFNDLFVKHDKGKSLSLGSQDSNANYTRVSYDYTINNISQADEIVETIIVKLNNPDCVVITCCSKDTLQGVPLNPPPLMGSYNVIDKMKRTFVHILIFKLLHVSTTHKVILDKYFCESYVPRGIDENTFQAIVGNLGPSPYVSFIEQDIITHKPSYNEPIHLELFVHKKKIRRVLIDGGVGLNICTVNLIKVLGYS